MKTPTNILRFYEAGVLFQNHSVSSPSVPAVDSIVIIDDIHYVVSRLEWRLDEYTCDIGPVISISVHKSASRTYPVRRVDFNRHKDHNTSLTLNDLIYILGALAPNDRISALIDPICSFERKTIIFEEGNHLILVRDLLKVCQSLRDCHLQDDLAIHVNICRLGIASKTHRLLGFTDNNILITQP